MGKVVTRYCAFECDDVPADECRMIGGSYIHDVDPPHRVADGLTVRIDGDRVRVVANAAIDVMADNFPDDRA